jgi:S-layer family protein
MRTIRQWGTAASLPAFAFAAVASLAGPSGVTAQDHSKDPLARPLTSARSVPKEFGIQDETRTVISALSFNMQSYFDYDTLGNLARYCTNCQTLVAEYYATLDLPAGVVIDYIGVNNTSDSNAVLGFALYQRDRYAAKNLLVGFSFPSHDWDTDFAGPLNILVPDHSDKELVLNVEQAASPNFQYFAWVEIWWHRTVSPPPATASFGDVPTSHPFFQFVEALKASGITGGCGNGTNYCPDSPLTRGQMAVFLAKALGLHYPF